jgi:hypothetical protein
MFFFGTCAKPIIFIRENFEFEITRIAPYTQVSHKKVAWLLETELVGTLTILAMVLLPFLKLRL